MAIVVTVTSAVTNVLLFSFLFPRTLFLLFLSFFEKKRTMHRGNITVRPFFPPLHANYSQFLPSFLAVVKGTRCRWSLTLPRDMINFFSSRFQFLKYSINHTRRDGKKSKLRQNVGVYVLLYSYKMLYMHSVFSTTKAFFSVYAVQKIDKHFIGHREMPSFHVTAYPTTCRTQSYFTHYRSKETHTHARAHSS